MTTDTTTPALPGSGGFLDRYFKLTEHGSNVRTELVAGLTTFLTMAYIIFVNPSILGDAGMPKGAVFVATCLIAALGTTIMGAVRQLPDRAGARHGPERLLRLCRRARHGLHLADGARRGVHLGLPVPAGHADRACASRSSRAFRIRCASPSRWVSACSWRSSRSKSAGIVAASKATYVTLGDLHQPSVVLAAIGFFAIVALDKLKVRGAILIGILLVTVLSFYFGGNTFAGVFSAPPSIEPTLRSSSTSPARSRSASSTSCWCSSWSSCSTPPAR